MELMEAFFTAVANVRGDAAAARARDMKITPHIDPGDDADLETLWENRQIARWGYIPPR